MVDQRKHGRGCFTYLLPSLSRVAFSFRFFFYALGSEERYTMSLVEVGIVGEIGAKALRDICFV